MDGTAQVTPSTSCTRRHRDAACKFRTRRGAVQIKAQPIPTSGRPAFDHHLGSLLAGDASSLAPLTALYNSHGWQPPPPARRDGGLWLLSTETIGRLPPPPAAPSRAMAYGTPWFEEHLKGGIPHVACARPPGAPLPSRALKYAQLGMCCILDNARLWPAAEDKWRHRAYLSQQLRAVDCSVLCSPSQSKRFSYWFDASGYSDRVQAGYQAKPYVTTKTMGIDQFLTASQQRNGSSLLYLQQSILQAPNENPTALQPCKGLGPGILSDIQSGIDLPAVKALAEAGGFGPWQRCQLFIGGKAAEGARSILHFDQYDNLFVQLSGTKTFILYDPQQTKHLYAYPIHHPLDTRSQVDLNDGEGCTKAYPRLNNAIGHKITLHAGQALFLPCYWWHEVLTEPTDDELTVSVNFWFAATNRLLTPTRPLVPCMQCECARQLEYLISDSLHDQAKLVPTFLSGLLAAIEAGGRGSSYTDALEALRPASVTRSEWCGLFEYVVVQLAWLLGPEPVSGAEMAAFVSDLCDASRFAQLRLN